MMFFAVYARPRETTISHFVSHDGMQIRNKVRSPCVWAKVMFQGDAYYWNQETDEMSWTKPTLEVMSAKKREVEARWGPSWSFSLDFAGQDAKHPRGQIVPPSPVHLTKQPIPPAAEWIKVTRGERPYFWHPQSGHARNSIPDPERVRWCTDSDKEGRWCYWDSLKQEATWSCPLVPPLSSPESSWMALGMAVQVDMPSNPRLDGRVGQIVDLRGATVSVQLSQELGGQILRVKQEYVRPCKPGTFLMLTGLQQEDLNGKMCKVISHDNMEGPQYTVRLADKRQVSVKMECTVVVPHVWHLDFTKVHEYLVWNAEQECTFMDSKGSLHRFHLDLPANFGKTHARGEAWPVLFYMHGAGGGSFYGQAKKSITTPGLEFAHQHFVVISPACKWNWKQEPHPWVAELVQHLSAASWVDHQRIYLAGGSMGGMGTWMVGSALPNVFAAIAPSAAHHDKAFESRIATQLANMPICVTHSTFDGCCPLSLEEPLWEKLLETNPQFMVWLNQDDHCTIGETAFWNSTCLYEWLLEHRRED